MNNFIRYKREIKNFKSETLLQEYFNELIGEGWEIIYYSEKSYIDNRAVANFDLTVTVVLGKRNN